MRIPPLQNSSGVSTEAPATERRSMLLDRLAALCETRRDSLLFHRDEPFGVLLCSLDRHLAHLSDDAIADMVLALGDVARAFAGLAGRTDGGTVNRVCRETLVELCEQLKQDVAHVAVGDGAAGDADLLLDDGPQGGGGPAVSREDDGAELSDDVAQGAEGNPDVCLRDQASTGFFRHPLAPWLVMAALGGLTAALVLRGAMPRSPVRSEAA